MNALQADRGVGLAQPGPIPAEASPDRQRSALIGLLLLWGLAVVLALAGLGEVALRDWDEGIVAGVALDASGTDWPQRLLPTYWGDPYLNKPPGIHLTIAALIETWRRLGGAGPAAVPPEWVVRLAPALLSSAVVPLVGMVELRLRPHDRLAALASASITLTLLPVARHGRMAMLDGTQLSAMVLLWWAVLTPAPGARRAGVLAGLAGSALLLLKAPVAIPMLLVALLLRALDRELSLRTWGRLLGGIALGLIPGVAWHGWHLLNRGPAALLMWTGQGFARVTASLGGHDGGPIPPLREVLVGGWPWLLLWPFAIALAWRQRHRKAGRWGLALTSFTALMVLPLRTQLPYYSLLLWPPLALICGPVLAWMIRRDSPPDRPPFAALLVRVPWLLMVAGAVLFMAGLAGLTGLLPGGEARAAPLLFRMAVVLGAGFALGGLGLNRPRPDPRRLGAIALLACLWLSLLMLFESRFWLWELAESWPVRPVAAVLRPYGTRPLQVWQADERPSLNWYVGRRIPGVETSADLRRDDSGAAWVVSGAPPRLDSHRCEEIQIPVHECVRKF